MKEKEILPELFVLGAGPGDPELITVKGYRILQEADVILYDNLANKDLLDLSKPECEKIYVGKKQIETIADTYIKEQRGSTPAAIIQHASLPQQKSVAGLVKDLPEMAAKHNLTYPAIIIIGDVVSLHTQINS